MLAVEGLEVRYGGITALRGVSIAVAEGETVLLVGANGAGKSSLINAVIGAVRSCAGSIHFDGRDLGSLSSDRRARAGIGYRASSSVSRSTGCARRFRSWPRVPSNRLGN
jgi:branched-chain amino acid transport system ATP-binding protein